MPTSDGSVDVSVVVPCFNAGDVIGRQLDALLAQETTARFEIVVADNRSSDESVDVILRKAEDDPRVRCVYARERQGVSYARNTGTAASRAGCILLCDADDEVGPGWIECYWRAFLAGAQLVGGPLRRVTVDGELLHMAEVPFGGRGILPTPIGANCGYTRGAFDAVNGFNEDYLGGGDDHEFFWRCQLVGYSLTWVPGAWINYSERTTIRETMRQHFSYGLSRPRLVRQFGASVFFKNRIPGRSIIAFLAGVLGLAATFGRSPRCLPHAKRAARNAGIIFGALKLREWRAL
jgi:glycosyltransferase involved in cell wall biosynthesis